jgi:hypothetical protein
LAEATNKSDAEFGELRFAAHSYKTLSDLRDEYLKNRANDVVASIENQTHLPGRRNDHQIWQTALQDSLDHYSESISFISVINSDGYEFAHVGPKKGASELASPDHYVIETQLEAGRGRGWGKGVGDLRHIRGVAGGSPIP